MVVTSLAAMSAFRSEMEKYRDVDEDVLLQKLTEDELLRLEDELQELDPDVSSPSTSPPPTSPPLHLPPPYWVRNRNTVPNCNR